ncbi:hypothetical protein B2A_08021 [mine drainage metagenome]|uniref:PLD phosphodiesterase domain-containing protein n=1 Tax=mine drainage metagenome TaxID=410659 RepID=T0ZIZ9_9ZZZZ
MLLHSLGRDAQMLGFNRNIGSPSKSYSGSESYKYVERLLRSSRSIDIVTPYIGAYYAKALVRHAASGKRIRVIIANGQAVNSEATSYVKSAVSGSRRYTHISVLSFLAFILSYLYGLQYLSLIFLLVFLFFLASALKRIPKKKLDIAVRYAQGFVHEKMYIGDSEAITGSANLTYSGMHKNIEHLEITMDAGKISDLEKHFNALWGNSSNI